jgi:membrane protein YdbS with pleckstrin-like domain
MEILYQEPIMTLTYSCQALITFLVMIGTVNFIIAIVASDKKIWNTTGIAAIIALVASCFLVVAGPKTETGRYEYMVQFKNDTSFVEVYEKYEVLEQKGNVWTIQDKEIE